MPMNPFIRISFQFKSHHIFCKLSLCYLPIAPLYSLIFDRHRTSEYPASLKMATQSSRDKSPRGFESTRDWVVPMPVVESQQPRYQLEPIERIDNATQVTPSWRSLFSFTTRAHSAPISCSAAASILAGILKPCASIFLGKIFSILTKFGDGTLDTKATLHGISIWCIALTGLGLSAWLLEGIFFSAWVIFGELQAQIVRLKMFAGMLDKELEWYDLREDGVGSLLIRIQT